MGCSGTAANNCRTSVDRARGKGKTSASSCISAKLDEADLRTSSFSNAIWNYLLFTSPFQKQGRGKELVEGIILPAWIPPRNMIWAAFHCGDYRRKGQTQNHNQNPPKWGDKETKINLETQS